MWTRGLVNLEVEIHHFLHFRVSERSFGTFRAICSGLHRGCSLRDYIEVVVMTLTYTFRISFEDQVTGPVVQLDLPVTLGKMSPWVNVRRLKFFEECDADLTDPDDGLVLSLISPSVGVHDPRYEVDKILWYRTFKGRCEMLVR